MRAGASARDGGQFIGRATLDCDTICCGLIPSVVFCAARSEATSGNGRSRLALARAARLQPGLSASETRELVRFVPRPGPHFAQFILGPAGGWTRRLHAGYEKTEVRHFMRQADIAPRPHKDRRRRKRARNTGRSATRKMAASGTAA